MPRAARLLVERAASGGRDDRRGVGQRRAAGLSNCGISGADGQDRPPRIADVTFATGFGLFYAWVFKDGLIIASSGRWILAGPVFLSLLATARIWARTRYIRRIEGYLAQVEARMFGDAEPSGWERHYASGTNVYPAFRIGTWVLVSGSTVLALFLVPLPQAAGPVVGIAATAAPGVQTLPCRAASGTGSQR
jgi:hypothetical protein